MKLRHSLAAAGAMTILALAMTVTPRAAEARDGYIGQPSAAKGDREHCIAPNGADLNEFYGLSERLVADPFCTDLRTGDQWRPLVGWVMNTSFERVPDGFVPAATTPLEDLRAKLVGVIYVVDPATRQQRTYTFANSDKLWTGVWSGEPFDRLPIVNTVTLGQLSPLSEGEHVIDVYWRLSAMHCDGLGTDPTPFAACIPAGDTLAYETTVHVATP